MDGALATLSKIAPVPRKPAAEVVVERLLELVHSGSLKAGDVLPTEHELAAALHVSRPVIREALRGLQILGVVETRQGGRCSVTDLRPERLAAPLHFLMPLDVENLDSLYDARSLLEGNLLERGTKSASPDTLSHLDHMVREGYRLIDDPVAFRVLDLEFHQTLISLSGNPFLERMAQSLYHVGTEFRRIASETPGVLAQSAAEHEVIVAAIRAGDGKRAAAAMRRHLASIHKTTRDAMSRGGR